MGKYITNVAQSFIGQLKINAATEYYGAQSLYERHHLRIKQLLNKMKPETLGRIAAAGKSFGQEAEGQPTMACNSASLYEVHCGTWLGKYSSGIELLREIACTAIVAEMANILPKLANR